MRYRLRVSLVVGNAISPARTFGPAATSFPLWGWDEHMVRAYIRNQEVEGERYEQMKPRGRLAAFGRLTVLSRL